MTKSQDNQIYVLEIPDVHPSLNVWTKMHHMKRYQLKKEWEHMVNIIAKKEKLPFIKKPVEIFITYYHPRKTVDLDNYTPKFICDALKSYFTDDNITNLVKLGWEFKTGKKRSVIYIKELVS